jgi:hypothetical protein
MKHEHDTWYSADVINNNLLGSPFTVGEEVCYRLVKTEGEVKWFEVFAIRGCCSVLSAPEIKTQLVARRNRKGECSRASDQGYINWKYGSNRGEI